MAEDESNSSSMIAQIEKVVTAALRPLPTETGDGSYVQKPTVTGLAKDLLNFDLEDAKTLAEVVKSAVTGEAVNDRDYVMERVVQVCVSTRNWLCSRSNFSTACCWLAFDISKW
jgi:linoleate 8R-lipoxygenase/9,12-octadecadienoate 8-hydroperoxide 8R-isomerase